jgi:hypothetical protein
MVRVTFKIIFLLAVAQTGGSLGPRAANQAAPALGPVGNTVNGRSEALSTSTIKELASQQSKASQERLIAYLTSSSTPQTKKAAIEALVQRGDPRSALAIAHLIQDPGPEIASEACWAIGELRDRRTSSEAVLALQRQIHPVVRVNCALAVGRINALPVPQDEDRGSAIAWIRAADKVRCALTIDDHIIEVDAPFAKLGRRKDCPHRSEAVVGVLVTI